MIAGDTPAPSAALAAANSLKRNTPWPGLAAPMRTRKRSPLASTRKLVLVIPPVSGCGSTHPDQQARAAARFLALMFMRPAARMPDSALRRREELSPAE